MGCVPAKHLWPDWCCMQRPMRRQSRRMVSQLTRVTNFSELEVKQWYRLFLKDCPEGVLGEERFVTFFCNFYKRGDLEKKKALATQIFRTFDRDGSGSVDFREFLCGMSALLRGTTAQRLRWAFNMYDLDRNGSLSREELLNVLKAYVLSFCNMSALLRGTTAQRLRWAFNMYDLDRNGSLRREELLNVLKEDGRDYLLLGSATMSRKLNG
ncbi:hypothetical protein Bbelb_252190 [Branchiostoma belcheri]|nr:hypothetical protein Bbelb_252190 [Branchiostoma belcheri]